MSATDKAAAGLGAAAAGLQAIPVAGNIAGAFVGLAAGLVKAFGGKRRQGAPEPEQGMAEGVFNGPGEVASGLNPNGPGETQVLQSFGMNQSAPTLSLRGPRLSLDNAKRDFVMQSILHNGDFK
ncbi:MAG TPA: hypothetical protein VM223_24370 [Planctomycetota bacterium]|nr:hypothetical protein [Planctomycetota bacterium]